MEPLFDTISYRFKDHGMAFAKIREKAAYIYWVTIQIFLAFKSIEYFVIFFRQIKNILYNVDVTYE